MKNNPQPENHLHQTQSRWFAVYTRFKREKMVTRELTQKGIEVFFTCTKIITPIW